MTAEDTKTLMETLLNKERREQFERQKSSDFSHHIKGVGRFRVAYCQERLGWAAVLRQIPEEIPRLHKLGAPAAMLGFTKLQRGLVLVTGPTGSGKSTTLAALLDVVNRERSDHILTVEDPIEFVHSPRRCIWTQREVGEDTPTFSQALRDGLRQDPDVILVGEMRDLETIRTAITAAETGHLVLATLHTSSAPDTINRVIGVFPEGEQQQIRMQLAASLAGIVCQTLLPTADGRGRVAAHEVLLSNTAVRAAIRENKMAAVRTVLQTQGAVGMQTLDKALVDLVSRGVIDPQLARERAQDEKEFDQLTDTLKRGNPLDLPPKVTRADIVTDMNEEAPLQPTPAAAPPMPAGTPRPPMPPARAATPTAPAMPAAAPVPASPYSMPAETAPLVARRSAPPLPAGVGTPVAPDAPTNAASSAAPAGPVSMGAPAASGVPVAPARATAPTPMGVPFGGAEDEPLTAPSFRKA